MHVVTALLQVMYGKHSMRDGSTNKATLQVNGAETNLLLYVGGLSVFTICT